MNGACDDMGREREGKRARGGAVAPGSCSVATGAYVPLSPREVEVLELIATGATNPAIARELTISTHTVKRHVANILRKMEASSRTEAAVRARSIGAV